MIIELERFTEDVASQGRGGSRAPAFTVANIA